MADDGTGPNPGSSGSLMLVGSRQRGGSPARATAPLAPAAIGGSPGAAEGVSCPFALIQAALESTDPADVAPIPVASKRSKQPYKPFAKQDLMESAIPEGISLKERALKDGLKEMDEEDDDDRPALTQLSGRGKIAITCPMSGAMGLINAPEGGDVMPKVPQLVRVGSAKSGVSFSQGSRVTKSKDGSSHGGKSKKSGVSGSRKSGKSRKQIKRRVKRTITFSEWEADTYIPQIKGSWSIILAMTTRAAVGVHFYMKFLKDNPEMSALFTSPQEALALKFADILDTIVAAVDSPAALHETLKALAPMHLKKGVQASSLPKFGNSLVETMAEVLGAQWTTEMKAAWEWLWAWLSQSMIQSLEEASNEATILSQSWDMAMDNCPGNEFGEMFFDVLFELAPNMKSLFNKPKQILSVKFMEMVSTLVSFNNDPVRMEQQSIWLGMRHVAYGARTQHTVVLGQVIITTLEQAVGEEWTAEMDKAWTDLWNSACHSMLTVTEDAETHGEVVRKMWKHTQERSNCAKFGSMLRKMLLSGTEWVQGLSQPKPAADTPMAKKHAPRPVPSPDIELKDNTSNADGPTNGKVSSSVHTSQGGSFMAEPTEGDERDAEQKKSDADAVGSHFWEMMTVLCELMWQPEQMNEKLTIMTKRFFEMGIRQAHLPTIGNAIITSCERVLAPNFGKKEKDAWAWFWKMIASSMVGSLDVLESGDVELIRESWEDCKGSLPAEELGELFFKELARIAPHVTHLFKRPKRIQALQFINVVEMLVSFNEEPERFFDELKPLTIRHIKFGVKADYARAFGMTVLTGISQALGDKFTDHCKKAWTRLWTRVSSCVTRSLNVGSNLVIVSLVQDDIENFMDAMACVPRGERFETLTKIDVNGEIISPLDWSISGGQFEIAKWILGDLLTIRADRETYYYGRDVMFTTHPLIVSKLSKQMPMLLDCLLDGLMWHASMVVEGKVRVNFYVRELYGVPADTEDSWETALGVLVSQGEPEVFNHPVVEKVLESKWNRFGNLMFVAIQIWFTCKLIIFTVGFAVGSKDCSEPYHALRTTVGAMGATTFFLQSVVLVQQMKNDQTLQCSLGGRKTAIPRFLVNPWNAARYISAVMLMVISFYSRCEHIPPNMPQELLSKHWHTVLTAATSIFLWVQFVQVLLLSDKFSAFMYSVGRMFAEIGLNFLVIFVILIAFGVGLSIMAGPGGPTDTIESSMLSILKAVLGLGNEDMYAMEGVSLAFLIISTILIVTCLINILIAQLCNMYIKLALNQEGYAKMNRAYICVEMESFLSIKQREKYFGELRFDEPLEFDSSDEGPAGGLQVLLPSSYRSHAKYIPDRVTRFTGEASPMDPWPSTRLVEEVEFLEADMGDETGTVD